MLRPLALFAMILVLGACAPRGIVTLMPEAAAVGTVEPIYLATSRGRSTGPDLFGNDRSAGLSYARYDVTIPPEREKGSVTFPGRNPPDPRKHMLTAQETLFPTPVAFRRALGAEIRAVPDQRRAVVFVHGFNTNHAEGIYRLAQMAYDMRLPGTVVHFSWPSAGNPLGYVHDRDSALFSRDALEQLLNEVSRSGATEIVLMAHSMGAHLAMETLRQMAIRGNTLLDGKLTSVILISPDIDVDVFRTQMAAIKNPPRPFVIFGSPADRALRLSARLTGEPERLGGLSDTSVIADLPVTFVDIEDFRDGTSHFAIATSPELLALIQGFTDANGWLERDSRRNDNPLAGILITTQQASRVILSPVAAVVDGVTFEPAPPRRPRPPVPPPAP